MRHEAAREEAAADRRLAAGEIPLALEADRRRYERRPQGAGAA